MKKINQEEYSRFVKNLKIYNIVAEILKSKVDSILLEYNLGSGHNAIQFEKTRIKSKIKFNSLWMPKKKYPKCPSLN